MSKNDFICSHCDMFGSLKENLTLKQAALLKLACWPLQSHGWLGYSKAMSEMTSNVKIYFVIVGPLGLLV
jgi:hypothetical protein